MVPYSQIPLALHVRLIQAYEHETGFRNILEEQYLVDENNLKSIIRNYRLHWKQRLFIIKTGSPERKGNLIIRSFLRKMEVLPATFIFLMI